MSNRISLTEGCKIEKVSFPDAWQTHQARLDEAIVTGRPMMERPFHYRNTENGQLYHDLYACVGWPSEVSDKDAGRPGYVAIVGVLKLKTIPIDKTPFQLLAEAENRDVPTLLDKVLELRQEYGFGLYPGLLQTLFGDPERYITILALLNEDLMKDGKGEKMAILVAPPDDFYDIKVFDNYARSLRSSLMPGRQRLYYGNCNIIKNRLSEFKRDDPAVYAVGGMAHSLLSRTMWMDQVRESAWTIDDPV